MVERSVSQTRNSGLRARTAGSIQGFSGALHHIIPGLTPTHINILGAVTVAVGAAVLASRNPRSSESQKTKTVVGAALVAAASALDAVDGGLARTIAKEDPAKVNFKRGQLYDVLGDRFQEWVLAISRVHEARKRGSKLGELAAFTTSVTSSWPSLARAYSETQGSSVPETGRSILDMLGTRVGRGISGTVATTVPSPKNFPFQAFLDGVTATMNIVTTVDRLRIARSGEDNLSSEVKGDAKVRMGVIGVFAVTALAGSLFTYLRLHRREKTQEKIPVRMTYKEMLSGIERYSQEQGLDARFVGGSLTDWIGPQTTFTIDPLKRTIKLHNPKDSVLIRSDGTVKDADLVCFTSDRSKFTDAKGVFKKWGLAAKRLGISYPYISMESARHSDWPKRQVWKQMVTAFEMDEQGTPRLAFGKVDQVIKPESLASWTVDLGDGTTITTFNPIAHRLCYSLRCPSGVKKKDNEMLGTLPSGEGYSKIGLLDNLAYQTLIAGYRLGIDYSVLFAEWNTYIEALSGKPDVLTRAKKTVIGLYWNTIGTDVAHGKGFWVKASHLSNRLTGQ